MELPSVRVPCQMGGGENGERLILDREMTNLKAKAKNQDHQIGSMVNAKGKVVIRESLEVLQLCKTLVGLDTRVV
jgi:hypothetical protein